MASSGRRLEYFEELGDQSTFVSASSIIVWKLEEFVASATAPEMARVYRAKVTTLAEALQELLTRGERYAGQRHR